jgi:hypothetical protein
MLAASANVIALLIQNVAIAHPKEAECRFARRLRTTGIGMVVASLIPFAIGMTVGRIGEFGSVVGYRRLSGVCTANPRAAGNVAHSDDGFGSISPSSHAIGE